MDTTNKLGHLAALMGLVASMALTGCGGDDSVAATPAPTPAPTAAPTPPPSPPKAFR